MDERKKSSDPCEEILQGVNDVKPVVLMRGCVVSARKFTRSVRLLATPQNRVLTRLGFASQDRRLGVLQDIPAVTRRHLLHQSRRAARKPSRQSRNDLGIATLMGGPGEPASGSRRDSR